MNLRDYAELLVAIVTLLTFFGTCWNAYEHRGFLLLLAEMRLNMQRELNGKYVRLDRFEDLKEHIKHLEEAHDVGH